MEGQGEGLPERRCRCLANVLPVPAAVASERVAAVLRVDLLHFWLGLSATAAPPPSPPLPNLPIYFHVGWVLRLGELTD